MPARPLWTVLLFLVAASVLGKLPFMCKFVQVSWGDLTKFIAFSRALHGAKRVVVLSLGGPTNRAFPPLSTEQPVQPVPTGICRHLRTPRPSLPLRVKSRRRTAM